MIYITGDTHGDIERIIDYKTVLNEKDSLIILGDFGFIWNDLYLHSLEELGKFKCKILFLDGNHENFTLLKTFPTVDKFNGKVSVLSRNVFWLKRGEIYTIEDLKFLTIGGANSIDKNRRVPEVSWWDEENINRDEVNNILANLQKHDFKVDYILTHTCKESEKEKLVTNFDNCITSQALTNLFKFYDIKYKHWYFGHFHEDKNLDKKHTAVYKKTILIKD